ncbi:MAG: hypothetical protein KJ077_28815 [Anaerolineae bacterium]|nr:hypothetical protein [Anaerolineae bacterium]
MISELIEPSWGVYLNSGRYINRPIPATCSAWTKPVDKLIWHKRGVVVWDNEAQQAEVLSARHALELLEYSQTTETWKVEGLPIMVQATRLVIDSEPKRKRSRKDAEAPKPQTDPKPQSVIVERFRLKPDASERFLALLQANETTLRQMAAKQEEEQAEVLADVYDFILRQGRLKQAEKLDLSKRAVTWVKDENDLIWRCDCPPYRGSVRSGYEDFLWQACIEQPDKFRDCFPFNEFEPALIWVEKRLIEVQNEPGPDLTADQEEKWPEMSVEEFIATRGAELAPYWIDPAALEPKRITYRVVIELDHVPDSFKTMHLSFGKEIRYDEKFPTPRELARELELDPYQVDIKPLIEDHGDYDIYSVATYYREDVALAQAQQLWDKSSTLRQFKAGKVIRAQYGIEEVETGYRTMLGGCENRDRPFPKPVTRAEHMARLALRETLAYALDVEGFRLYLGIPSKYLSDEDLLVTLHKTRAKSKYIPPEAQVESQHWLKTHHRSI